MVSKVVLKDNLLQARVATQTEMLGAQNVLLEQESKSSPTLEQSWQTALSW
jgi:heat shock protein HslJ